MVTRAAEDGHLQPIEATGVGEQIDRDDPSGPDGERESDTRLAAITASAPRSLRRGLLFDSGSTRPEHDIGTEEPERGPIAAAPVGAAPHCLAAQSWSIIAGPGAGEGLRQPPRVQWQGLMDESHDRAPSPLSERYPREARSIEFVQCPNCCRQAVVHRQAMGLLFYHCELCGTSGAAPEPAEPE